MIFYEFSNFMQILVKNLKKITAAQHNIYSVMTFTKTHAVIAIERNKKIHSRIYAI